MAKRATTKSVQIVRATPVKPQPVTLRIATPRPVQASKAPSKRRGGRGIAHRARKAWSGATLDEKAILMTAGGGLALGFIEGQGWADMLPDIPIVGKKGAITVAAYLLYRQGMAREITSRIAIAGAAICGYQLGKEGEVTGE